jgi:predicted transcriptional regulator
MAHLQEIFDRVKGYKKEKREISESYRDALNNSQAYQNALDELKKLKAKKKNIEQRMQEECSNEYSKIKKLKKEIIDDNQRLSDLALSHIMRGERIEIKDGFNNKYEPVFKVIFKKVD